MAVKSDKNNYFPTRNSVKSGNQAQFRHPLCYPARTVDLVPGMNNTLLSASKCTDAENIQIYNKNEMNMYDARTTTITVS